jgi:DUF4097 and DUF4098 domain-containing protein YvlB
MRKLVLLILVLIAPAVIASPEKRVHKTVSLNANGRLSISTHNGSITVTTWNQPVVDVDARIVPNDWSHDEDVDRTEVRVSGSGGSVDVESDFSAVHSHLTWFGIQRSFPLVHYNIKMPATASLAIDDHNANVRITGLRNDVKVDAHNGGIELVDFEGGASIETHNGSVSIAYSRFTKPSRFETHNGSLDIRMPAAARFHLDARGHHLGVSSEFPVVTEGFGESRYVGNVNGGGPELRFTTHNGSIRLRKG